MWKDTQKARVDRYRDILKACPKLYQTAEKEALEINTEADTVCSYVLAPALHGYVYWVLSQAMEAGVERLYFLARDGYLMYEAARKICEKLELPVKCIYLSCSRYSIRIPVYHLNYENALEYVCRGGIDVTLDKIFSRAALNEQEKQQMFEEFQRENFGIVSRSEKLSHAVLTKIREVLRKNQYFKSCIEAHSRAAMPGLEGYLRQEGLLDSGKMALVDSGWVGSMQKVLNQVITYIRNKEETNGSSESLEGYYWGLYELPEGVNPQEYHCYYFSPGANLKEKVYFSNCLFEVVFSAPHGMTMGYEQKKDGTYEPVYADISDAQYDFMKQIEKRMAQYTEILLEDINSVQKLSIERDREVIAKMLQIFMGEPTAEEAETFGSLSFSDDILDSGNHQIADLLTEKELNANHVWRKIFAMCGIGNKYVKESAWYEGSAVRGGTHVKHHLRRYAAYKYLLYLRKRHLWRKIYG